jgi:hypothetical protein
MSTYPIDPDVRRMATRFGLDPALIQAVVTAEGGIGHIVKAVQCSIPSVTTLEKALEITCRSAVHRMTDYVKAHSAQGYVEYFASKWAPQGVANDPTHLNKNWPGNVLRLWLKGAP